MSNTESRWMPGVDQISFGGDYNPEQWPRETWLEDIRLMKVAGVNLVSIGIFSWALLEPREGEYEFGWLDDVIALLTEAGIGISLATPTASPPAWFWTAYPQARPVTKTGLPLGFGSRGMASPSSPEYARAVTGITTQLARRYGAHPGVKIWHVHNEYGTPISECYSDYSVLAFREWLKRRYVTLDELNRAWGTSFWGQRYGQWNEIDAPRVAATTVNPSQQLDFARFSNDALLACFIRERDILHELSPGVPVTTNFMATSCPSVDYWKWAREVDIVSNDHYLTAERPDNHILLALDADMVRSLAGGKPWLLMEHSTSAVNWQERNLAKRPRELARNSLSHFARGADGIMYFQWRAARFGAEKFHSAMVPHGGPESRIFAEVVELGSELGGMAQVLGTRVTSRVAILWDWESFWAQDLEWRPSADLSHRRQLINFYTSLWLDGVTVDFAHPESDLSAYDLVVAPSLYLMSETASRGIGAFVRGGGTFVAGYFSGIVDPHDTVPLGAVPGGLRDVLGLTVDEFRPLGKEEQVTLSNGLRGAIWTDDITTTTAVAVATYVDGPSAGGTAVTRNELGQGVAWYISTELAPDQLSAILRPALADASIDLDPTHVAGSEVVVRSNAQHSFTTYINHLDRALTIEPGGQDLKTGGWQDAFELGAGETLVVRRDR